jgi:L-alanine-DL-glutamate epimerase-like enolase superfamily enzyme
MTPRQTTPTRYHGRMERSAMSMELVRLTLSNGAEGAASYLSGYRGRETGCVVREIEAIAERVLGGDAGRRTEITERLLADGGEGPWEAVSVVDCAMWDAYGRSVGQPVWRLLGGYRERIPAYASTDAYLTLEEYLDDAKRYISMGYPAIKFHMNTDSDFDLEMVAAMTRAYGDGKVRFMTDQEQLCTFDEALRLGEAMSKGPFDWLEAPLVDTELEAYVELNRAVAVDVLPAGNTLVGMANWREGLARKAWSRLRFDVCNAGGISMALKAFGLARAMAVPVELQSYGFGPAQLANLHVMLGLAGATWFEQPAPSAPFDFPLRNPPRLDAMGCVAAPRDAGFGGEIDWADVEAQSKVTFDSQD